MNQSTVKRPKPSDTEDDLIKEQEEFMKGLKAQKVVPAAKILKRGDKQLTEQVQDEVKEESMAMEEDVEGEESGVIEHPMESVLFQVTERPFDPDKLQDFTGLKAPPQVIKVQLNEGGEVGKKSLFAKSFDARQEARRKARGQSQQSVKTVIPTPVNQVPSTSKAVPDREEIGGKVHPYLAGMTSEEILLEQQKLLGRLDPKLVEFLRKRSQAPGSSSKPEKMEVSEAPPPLNISEDDLPIHPKSVESFPSMNKLEQSKLAWAGVIKDELPPKVPEAGNSARFDFTGLLLPSKSTDSSTFDKALHHHGDEMERPGYTIEELLTLGRSTNFQQRSIALDTLGNIYGRAHTGIYDDILEQSLFHLLDMMEFIHVIRKGLDNNDSNSINSALYCLSSLLYVEHEEACLDAVYLWPGSKPFPLLVSSEEKKQSSDDEMKDFEYLQLDLIDFLLTRTEVLTRVEYLLESKSELLNEKGVTSLLKILIRVGRHSPNEVVRRERILNYVVSNHVSPNWFILRERERTLKGVPLIHALKLVRVLLESSEANALKLYEKGILPSVMSYLAYDQWKEQSHVEEVEDLVLESFRIWLSFLSLGIAIDEYSSFFPVIMRFLQFYMISDNLNPFDLHHSAHLFALLTQVVCFGDQKKGHSHWGLVKDAVQSVESYCFKLMKILTAPHLQGNYSIDLALLSLAKGLEFLDCSIPYEDKARLASKYQPVLDEFRSSAVYLNLTSNLISHSIILEETNTASRYPSNFATIGGTRWEGELNPVMKSNSPFYFLTYFIRFVHSINGSCPANAEISNYLSKLENSLEKSDIDYFIRFELTFLNEILNTLPPQHPTRFPLAYKSLALVPFCCSELFKKLLKVCLESCCEAKDLSAVFQFYLAYFGFEKAAPAPEKETKVKFEDGGHPGDDRGQLLFSPWSGKRTDQHWIFDPLENLYKRATGSPGYVTDNLEILEMEARGCLAFIHHCLLHYSSKIITNSQDLVTVYSRICRVFMLGSPSIYFDYSTTQVLHNILQIILKLNIISSKKSVFSQHKPSKSASISFYDFYLELVTEFFDNSYFNPTFLSYLLLPLRSAEDSRVKTSFWTHEHLSSIRLQEVEPIPLNYLGKEKDPKVLSLLTCLLKKGTVASKRNPFLYKIITNLLLSSDEYLTLELRQIFNSLKM